MSNEYTPRSVGDYRRPSSDADQLRVIADYLDHHDAKEGRVGENGMQRDLRRIADSLPTPPSEGGEGVSTSACLLSGGPADGDVIFTATHRCASRLIIYRADTDEMCKGRPVVHNFHRPAVYVRDDAPEYPTAQHFHEGLDRVVRAYPVVRYRFACCLCQSMAARMQAMIDREKDESDFDGASL